MRVPLVAVTVRVFQRAFALLVVVVAHSIILGFLPPLALERVGVVVMVVISLQGCQMAKFDPFLSLDCARVEGVGHNPRKGRDQILQRSVAEP